MPSVRSRQLAEASDNREAWSDAYESEGALAF